MQPVEDVVNGRKFFDMKNECGNVGLDEDVVTTLGITRDKKPANVKTSIV
jgi:hypothetical protein